MKFSRFDLDFPSLDSSYFVSFTLVALGKKSCFQSSFPIFSQGLMRPLFSEAYSAWVSFAGGKKRSSYAHSQERNMRKIIVIIVFIPLLAFIQAGDYLRHNYRHFDGDKGFFCCAFEELRAVSTALTSVLAAMSHPR